MKIWLINHYAVPSKYYPLARPENFARHLIAMGHEVTIFAASSVHNSSMNLIEDNSLYREEIENGIHYVYVRASQYKGNKLARIINMFQFPLRLPRVCKNFSKPDAIVATSVTPMACKAGVKLAQKYGCKCVAEIADLWPESFVGYGLLSPKNPLMKILYRYERNLYTMAPKIVFTMEGGKDYIIEKGWSKEQGGPIDLKKVHHINNGVDLDVFYRNVKEKAFKDPDLDNPNTFKVVYPGSIRTANRQLQTVFKAIEIMQGSDCENVEFLIYGKGEDRDKYEDFCQQKNIKNVKFKGFVPKEKIPYILSKCNLGILDCAPSDVLRFGGSQNKLFDYLASGIPVVTGEDSEYSVVKKYRCGYYGDFRDPQKLKETILQAKSLTSNEQTEFSKHIKNIAKKFDFCKLTEDLMGVINDV